MYLALENKKCKEILKMTGNMKLLTNLVKRKNSCKRGKKLSEKWHKVAFKCGYIGERYFGFEY